MCSVLVVVRIVNSWGEGGSGFSTTSSLAFWGILQLRLHSIALEWQVDPCYTINNSIGILGTVGGAWWGICYAQDQKEDVDVKYMSLLGPWSTAVDRATKSDKALISYFLSRLRDPRPHRARKETAYFKSWYPRCKPLMSSFIELRSHFERLRQTSLCQSLELVSHSSIMYVNTWGALCLVII